MIRVRWEDPDGKLWDLSGGTEGVQLASGSVVGLRNPPAETFTRTSSFVDGQVVTGWKLLPRPLELPLDVHGTTAEEWFVRDRAIHQAFRYDRTGILTVTDPFGGQRSIRARLDPDDDGLPEDPTSIFASTPTFSLIADNPWFYGEPIQHEFENANPGRGLYGPRGYGPPFYLAPSTFVGEDTLRNPGDAPAWGLITIPGPCDGFSILIGNRLISGFTEGVTLPAGETLTIDTNPERSYALLSNGQNIIRYLTSTQFAAVPDGSSVPLRAIVSSPGNATLTLTPRYLRAW